MHLYSDLEELYRKFGYNINFWNDQVIMKNFKRIKLYFIVPHFLLFEFLKTEDF